MTVGAMYFCMLHVGGILTALRSVIKLGGILGGMLCVAVVSSALVEHVLLHYLHAVCADVHWRQNCIVSVLGHLTGCIDI